MAKTPSFMIDSMGREVPYAWVPKYDRVRDQRVNRIVDRFTKARSFLERLMSDTLADLDAITSAQTEAGKEASEKGNLQVSSFDGMKTVSLNVRYEIHLDERVIKAREMMLEYARGIQAKLSGPEAKALEALIDWAFQSTRSGALSVARVLSLMRQDVPAKEWQEAKRLLSESMETRRGKSYLSVTTRPSRQHDPVPIRLDLADCWPMPTEASNE